MFRRTLTLTAIILVFSACEVQADQISSTWLGGSQGNWDNASNWNPAIVPNNTPTATFAVTIDAGVGAVRVYLRYSSTIDELDCRGEVRLDGWKRLGRHRPRLVNVSGLTNYGHLEVEGIQLGGNITNHGDLEIDEVELIIGNVMNYGYLELAETEVIGDVTNYDEAKLEFEDPGAEINGNLCNLTGGTIEVQSLAEIKQGDIENAGTIIIRPLGQMMFENHFRNTGKIQLAGGSLLYWDEEDGPGIFDNNSPGIIKGFGVLEANQLIQNKDKIHSFGGSLSVGIEGALINKGVLCNLSSSSLHLKPGEDVNNQGAIEVNAGGGVVFDCNLVNDTNGVIELLGGALSATSITQTVDANFAGFGGISVADEVLIESGAKIELTGPTNIVGDMTIDPDARLEISDGQTLITGRTTNNGTIHLIDGRVVFQGGYSGSGVVKKHRGRDKSIQPQCKH